MAEVYVEVKGCDAETEFNLVCTEEQFKFLREFAKMTNIVSGYSCMPVINLYQQECGQLDEDAPLKTIMFNDEHETEDGDIGGGYNLDTTGLS